MRHRGHRIVKAGWAVVLGTAFLAGAGVRAVDPPLDLEARLEALEPSDPRAYFELAEELADREGEQDRRLARRLFGLAGRLDPEKYAASAALALAASATDPRNRSSLRAAASLLPGGTARGSRGRRYEVDQQTAFELSEAFGEFRTGRLIKMREVLDEPATRRILQAVDQSLPGGVKWLEDAVGRGRRVPDLSRAEQVAMLRLDVTFLEGGRPAWSTLLEVEGDPPLLEVDAARLEQLLLDENPLRPVWREGRWSER